MQNDPIDRLTKALETVKYHKGDLTEIRLALVPIIDEMEAFIQKNDINPIRAIWDEAMEETRRLQKQADKAMEEMQKGL